MFIQAVPAFANEKRPPNIVFIMADDLGYGDLGCYGQEEIVTPHIDALAAHGIRLTQAYAGSTVCTPSRSIVMTGLHNGHTPARNNVPHYDTYLKDGDITVAEILKSAGYRIGGIGKWSLGDSGTEGRATRQGFDMWYGYLNQDHAHYYYTEYLDDNEGRHELPGNSKSHEFYSHDLMTDRALQFIEQSADEPFFFYGAYTLPHFSSIEEDPTELAIPSDEPYSGKSWSQKAKNYAAMVTLLDRDVGRIVGLLEELGLRESTLIVFTSDNGPWGPIADVFDSNGPLRGVKRDLYEGGIRVPFIANWPGTIPEGVVSDEIVAAWDLLPTFAEIAGAVPPDGIDGHSIVDVLQGRPAENPHPYLYFDFGHTRSVYQQAVRVGNWKAVRIGLDGEIELYDLSSDIGEENDLAQQYPEQVAAMKRIMETAAEPDPRYAVGELYRGGPIWKKSEQWPALNQE
ncbi:arylsulfatase [Pelagicoccus enzymogenes]|nr:arylsulfatase [Pelagicoccus enzymogenes]